MGCTSSVPNMADVQSNNAGKEEESENLELQRQPNDTKPVQDMPDDEQTKSVLPTCDNLDENIQLTRTNYSISFLEQQVENEHQPETSVPEKDHQINNDHSNLKDLVEQVILENIFKSTENLSILPEIEPNCTEKDEKNTEENKEPSETCVSEEISKNKDEDETLEESVSPSQSELSRATRWEALADIAAELPPSLAVDPLTGQIYSLAK